MIVPIMALAGSLVQKKVAPASAGTFPVSGGTFLILLLGTVPVDRCAEFPPGAHAWTGGRALPQPPGKTLLTAVSRMKQKAPSLFDWNIAGPAIGDAFKKLNPRLMIKNPVMFVTMVGAALDHRWHLHGRAGAARLRCATGDLAVVHRALRQLRRSCRGRSRQSAGRQPAQEPARTRWRAACTTAVRKKSPHRSCRRTTSSFARRAM